MGLTRAPLLGFIAGLTILLGLGAVGMLMFSIWDVLTHAREPIDEILSGP